IENMSYFSCPDCGKVVDIFRRGGGKKMSQELGVPLLGEIPIDPAIAETGDRGTPIVAARPESMTAKAYQIIAGAIAAQMSMIHMRASGEPDAPIDIRWQAKKS
ncbi:MAG: P-loop NTPase, partial [Candidatus Omnitrophica bacterium]|nr:P-loop NTPase [Candidatus Omnitrophota bacterium]